MPAFAADAGLVFGDVCVICQDDVTDRGRLDGCAHLFCVPCIVRWAEVETKCPLCKARFEVIYPEAYRPDGATAEGDGEEGDDDATRATRTRSSRDLCARGRAPEALERRVTRSRRRRDDGPGALRRPIRVAPRDQTYEDPDGDPLNGPDLDDVTCGTCGEGGDEDRLMLCDGCDAGHHCFCVGLASVPLEEWRCRLCAETEAPPSGGPRAEDGDDSTSTRTVAAVRALHARAGLTDEEEREPSSSAAAGSRAAARRRAAGLRAARLSVAVRATNRANRAYRAHATTPESRAPVDATGARAGGLEGDVGASFDERGAMCASRRGDSFSSSRRAAFPRPGGAAADARRRQMARVRELRRMWDQYRNGEIAFDGACVGTTTTAMADGDRGERPAGARAGAEPNARTEAPPFSTRASPERSDAERRRLAAAATLAAVGWSGGGGEACLTTAPGRVFSGGASVSSRRDAADDRDGGPPSGGGLLKRARRREPAARRTPSVGSAAAGNASATRGAGERRLPEALAGAARPGGAGSGPDLKGAFAGVEFSPPKRASVRAAAAEPDPFFSRAEASGWTSSDEDLEADAPGRPRPTVLPANRFEPGLEEPKPKPKEKVFLASQATAFVPPGSVTHVPPAARARDAEATRRAMLRDAEAAGAPGKARVIQMVKALLKPYWVPRPEGPNADDPDDPDDPNAPSSSARPRRRIRSAEQFKDLAKRASAAARAAAAAAALKHGAAEEADGAREEAIARAVRRAVDAALARAGIEATTSHRFSR